MRYYQYVQDGTRHVGVEQSLDVQSNKTVDDVGREDSAYPVPDSNREVAIAGVDADDHGLDAQTSEQGLHQLGVLDGRRAQDDTRLRRRYAERG